MPKETLLVLLGSGATISEVGGVGDVTKHLEKCANFRADRVFLDASADESLFMFIARNANICQTDPAYNFENILNIIEGIISDQSSGRRLQHFEGFKPRSANDVGVVHQEICYEVLTYFRARRSSLDSKGRNLPLVRGLEELSTRFDLKVFSLNYDEIPSLSDIRFFDGYMGGTDHFSSESLLNADVPGRKAPWHIPLHGSLRFGPALYRDERFGRVPIVPKYPTVEDAAKEWRPIREMPPLIFEKWDDNFADGLLNVPMPMITGFRKSDRTLHEPYMTYFHAFRDMLRSTRKWLVVGYGGNDAHINAHMRSALFEKAWMKPEEYYESLVTIVDWISPESKADKISEVTLGNIPECPKGIDWLNDDSWMTAISKIVMRWGSPYWFKENDDWKEVGNTGRVVRKSFSKLTNRLSVCFDGGSWAFGDGLEELVAQFSAPPIPKRGGR